MQTPAQERALKKYRKTHKQLQITFSPEYSKLVDVYVHIHGEHLRVAMKKHAETLLDKVKTL